MTSTDKSNAPALSADDASDRSFGVYVHIPYCRSLCPYCDFNSYVDATPPWPRFEQALLAELYAHAASFTDKRCLQSIYFGGGTPSLAPPSLIARVVDTLTARCLCAAHLEVSLEANPGTVDRAAWRAFADAGVNRASLGWQSADDAVLRVLGRGHTVADNRTAYADARAAGISNISIDLIFAVPDQDLARLEADLDAVIALTPEHVSIYELTYHEDTPFYSRRAAGRLRAVDEDLAWRMTERIEERLCAAGYEHYEISNYARGTARRAVHNSLYWSGAPYLGIGPGAHSFWRTTDFTHGTRWENLREPGAYLACWGAARGRREPASPTTAATNVVPPAAARVAWSETLGAAELTTERIFCGLRHVDGAPLPLLLPDAVCEAVGRGWATVQGQRLVPTKLGFRYADSLAALFT